MTLLPFTDKQQQWLSLLFPAGPMANICFGDACEPFIAGAKWFVRQRSAARLPYCAPAPFIRIADFQDGAEKMAIKSAKEHRVFLVELDETPLDQQIDHFKIALKMPYSSIVYSGGKSFHFLIVLDDVIDLETHRFCADWIMNIVRGSHSKADGRTPIDETNKNPVCFTRFPDVLRPDTGKLQELVELRGRISCVTLLGWLEQYEHLRPEPRLKDPMIERATFSHANLDEALASLSNWAVEFIAEPHEYHLKMGGGARQHRLKALVVHMAARGFSAEQANEIILHVQNELGLEKERRGERLIEWAVSNGLFTEENGNA